MSDWQGIESAPKDGTYVLLFWPQRPPGDVGRWTIDPTPPHRAMDEGFKGNGDNCIPREQPTHWMPLPPPPGAKDESAT